MFSLLLLILLVPLTVLVFWYPFVVSLIILILYFFIEVSAILPILFKTKPLAELGLTKQEEEIFSRYYVFFRYRIGAQDFSRMLAIIQISAFVLVPLLLFKGQIIQAVILVVNYFIAAPFAVRLNPVHYLGQEIKKGKSQFLQEYQTIASVSEKINAYKNPNAVE